MTNVRTAMGAAGVMLSLGCVAISAHGQVSWRVVALSGDPVPGVAGATLATLNQVAGNAINSQGRVSFAATGQGQASGSLVLTDEPSGSLRLVARSGTTAPDGFAFPALGAQARTMLLDDGSTVFGSDGLARERNGVFSRYFRGTAPAAGYFNGFFIGLDDVTGLNLTASMAGNASGQVVARTLVQQFGDQLQAFYRGVPGSFGLAEGSVPLGQVGTIWLGPPAMNASGTMVFLSRRAFAGGSEATSLMVGQPGAFVPVVSVNDAAPGLPAGLAFRQLGPLASINSAGDVAFWARLKGPGVDNFNDATMWARINGQLVLVARELSQVPGQPPTTQYSDMGSPDNVTFFPLIGDGGHVAFPVELRVLGQPVRTILRRDPDGTIRFIAREGDPVPGFPGQTIPTIMPTGAHRTFHMNRWGQVMISTGFPSTGALAPQVLLATDRSDVLQTLAITGTAYTVRGTSRTLLSINSGLPQSTSSGGADGRPRMFTDEGEAVFHAHFSGGVTGIVVAKVGAAVPAPTCDSIDFNNDGISQDPTDIQAFLSRYSNGPCIPVGANCADIDFNNDGISQDPTDIQAFLSVYSNGPCF